MSDKKTLQIQRISGHPGPVAGEGMSRQEVQQITFEIAITEETRRNPLF